MRHFWNVKTPIFPRKGACSHDIFIWILLKITFDRIFCWTILMNSSLKWIFIFFDKHVTISRSSGKTNPFFQPKIRNFRNFVKVCRICFIEMSGPPLIKVSKVFCKSLLRWISHFYFQVLLVVIIFADSGWLILLHFGLRTHWVTRVILIIWNICVTHAVFKRFYRQILDRL